MKKAFTLIELLVVIAIIGVLMGILIGTFAGSTESARSARCMSNLKNLASAVQTAAGVGSVDSVSYPLAGNMEKVGVDASQGTENAKECYSEIRGWISWDSEGVYAGKPTSMQASADWTVPMYISSGTDQESQRRRREYSLTNGVIWKYTGCNHSVYLCPSHVKAKKQLSPNFSYVMNAYFGWSSKPGDVSNLVIDGDEPHVRAVKRAEARLLFAEIPFADIGYQPSEAASGYETDAILQYEGCTDDGSYAETIGFNHKGGQIYFAHIVYQDGHVEKLKWPKSGMSKSQESELAAWLCEAKDVSFDGKKYEEMKD